MNGSTSSSSNALWIGSSTSPGPSLVQQDVDALSRDPSIAAVTEEARGQATASFSDNSESVTFDSIPANFFTVRNFVVANGYPFTDNDVQSLNHVAVIGSSLASTLFGPGSGAALATVVGVLVEVPVMLSVCAACNRTRHWFLPCQNEVC